MRTMMVMMGMCAAAMVVMGCAQKREELPQMDAASISETPEAPLVVQETPAPAPAATMTEPQEAATTYTVQRGDTLYSLAKRFYGDGKLWTKIADANKDKVRNVNAIPVGAVLTIPPK